MKYRVQFKAKHNKPDGTSVLMLYEKIVKADSIKDAKDKVRKQEKDATAIRVVIGN